MELVAGSVGRAVGFDPVGNGFEHLGVLDLRPFGVEPDVLTVVAILEFFSPFGDGVGVFDDNFEFVGLLEVFVEGKLPPFGAEGDPVEVALEGKAAAGFEVDGEVLVGEFLGEIGEVVDGGFTSGDDNDFAMGVFGLLGEGLGRNFLEILRFPIGVPGSCGVTPWAFHRAALESDEVGGFSEVYAFALPGVETLVDRQGFHGA